MWIVGLILLAQPAGGQTLSRDLAKFVEIPAVTGYESSLAKEIASRIAALNPQTDNLGNVYVTLGSGAPHRLIVAPMDEPGYVVSGITDDGYLRVQRLPQQAPHGLFDELHAAQPVVIETRTGKQVSGIVAGLSTHLQGGRRDAPRVTHPDEIYIDVGASAAEQVRQAGVDLLDPIALERTACELGFEKVAGMSIGDRFGAAALVELLRNVEPDTVKGTLTVAFVAQQWATSRGLDRLMQHVAADEVIYVGRLLARRGGFGPAAPQAQSAPEKEPVSGVLIGSGDPNAALTGLAAELLKLAEENHIAAATDFTAPLPRVSYTRGPEMPERFAHLAIATSWPSTPAELIDSGDLKVLAELLKAYAFGPVKQTKLGGSSGVGTSQGPDTGWGPDGPSIPFILERLVQTYGVSGHEDAVREEIQRLLPPWAKPETDDAGNLILRFGGANVEGPRLLFVAHMDEIGYVVRSIEPDGRLAVQSRGGGILQFFAGHPVLVRTANGVRPGVLELPAGWDQPDFEWPRGRSAELRVYVGARSAAEVEQLGVEAGDWMTVPKKYRRLLGTRANGRSFDDRVGCAALVAATWALGADFAGRDVTFVWATEEEVGLRGAFAVAERLAKEGRAPEYVFAVDTFVSSDSPLESKRFAAAEAGKGFVVRAVDNSNIVARKHVDRVVSLAKRNRIAVQYGVTGGGNDGAVFLRHGATDIPLGWALRYSHSPGEVIDTRDAEALAKIVAAIARSW